MNSHNMSGFPSLDKPWLKYFSDETNNAMRLESTVYEYIWDNNKGNPNDVALIYFGQKITYGELFQNIEIVRNVLLNYGIRKGDKVILLTSSTPETVYTVLALCRIGAVADMVNPLFSEEQILARINETEGTLLIVLDQFYEHIIGVLPQTCVKKIVVVPVYRSMPVVKKAFAGLKLKKSIAYSDTVVSWDEFLTGNNNSNNDTPDTAYEKDLPLIMVYSSGSTGSPKGIVLTNAGINHAISYYHRKQFPCDRTYSYLQVIPVWFSTGIVVSLLTPLSLGLSVILEPNFSKESFVNDIKRYSPNMTVGATSLWLYAVTCKELQGENLSCLKYPFTGGEKLSEGDETRINTFLRKHGCDCPLLAGYGMCELGGPVAASSSSYHKIGSPGIPITNVTVSAFNPVTNKEMHYGECGEIRVDSPCRMKEYFKNPQATEQFFWQDGNGRIWGCTGDIGYIDEDGFLFVKGRATDSCTLENGKLVYLFDIEEEILKNESVAQCKVVDTIINDAIKLVAHIVFREGVESSVELLRIIHDNLKLHLPSYMVPDLFKVRDSLPVHANGKRDIETLKRESEGFTKV